MSTARVPEIFAFCLKTEKVLTQYKTLPCGINKYGYFRTISKHTQDKNMRITLHINKTRRKMMLFSGLKTSPVKKT